ncbi:MAG: alpha/beta hydrolase [Gemmatimonadales bacterium]
MHPLRLVFSVLQPVAPRLAARWAEQLFFAPPLSRRRSPLTAEGRRLLETGHAFTVSVGGERVAAWSWSDHGRDHPAVYLVHGWGSRGGRLAAFVPPLLRAGVRVITFDAPGHGASEGRLSSMPQFARAFRAVVDAAGPAQGVIAHSMGASASALAMSWGLTVGRAVFLAPAADPSAFAAQFAAALGLGPRIMAGMRERSERRLAFRWADLNIPTLARGISAPPPLLVFHDRGDAVVPWSDGAAIAAAWPGPAGGPGGAELASSTGLGHRDLVRAPDVVARAVAFILEGRTPRRGSELPSALVPEDVWLERDLFDREARRRRVFS